MTWGDRRRWANLSPLHVLQLHSPARRPNCSMPQACPPSDLNASTRLARSGLWHRRFAGSFPRGSVTLAAAVSTSPPPSRTRIRVRFFSAPPARSPPLPWRVPRCSCFFHFEFSLSLSYPQALYFTSTDQLFLLLLLDTPSLLLRHAFMRRSGDLCLI
jgi:hypothetical protein